MAALGCPIDSRPRQRHDRVASLEVNSMAGGWKALTKAIYGKLRDEVRDVTRSEQVKRDQARDGVLPLKLQAPSKEIERV